MVDAGSIFAKVSLFLASAAIICAVILFSMNADDKKKFNRMNEQAQENTRKQNSSIDELSRKLQTMGTSGGASRGPQGVRGPPGPQGVPGGFYSASGPILNMATKKVGTPTFGNGFASIVYLDDKRYSPIQYWYLENQSNGTVKVKNKFTAKCLTANNLGDVYSDNCSSDNNSQNFTWGPSMQLSSSSFPNQCVSIQQFERNNNNSNDSYNYDNLQAKPRSNTGTVQKMKLEACSSSLNPNQTWYIGN